MQLNDPSTSNLKILEKLGKGGMGEVYKAWDKKLERTVAVKILSKDSAFQKENKEQFIIEAKAAARLNHPNIATVYQIEEIEDDLYIIMEFVEGTDFQNHIRKSNPIALTDALNFAAQVASGLETAHSKDIWHRDIKSRNILLKDNGQVKIMDFGLATFAGQYINSQDENESGTATYLSPEQTLNKAVDHRTDIWAFGVFLYELMTGKLPFYTDFEQELIYIILNKDPAPPENYRREIPSALSKIIFKALQKNADNRYQSMHDLLSDLNRVIKNVNGSSNDYDYSLPEPSAEIPFDRISSKGERRQVAIVISEISGFEDLVENLQPKEVKNIMGKLGKKAAEIAHNYQGLINNFSEDEIEMTFGLPLTHEDDLSRAVRSALELHYFIDNLNADLSRRINCRLGIQTGIDSGKAIVQSRLGSQRKYKLTGQPKQIASRLASDANTGEIIVLEKSHSRIKAFFDTKQRSGVIHLKEWQEPVKTFNVENVKSPQNRFKLSSEKNLSSFTGREKELEILLQCSQKIKSKKSQIVTISAEAGLGKSRLIHEFKKQLDQNIQVVQGDCHSFARNIPFYPFIAILKEIFKLKPENTNKVNVKNIQSYLPHLDAKYKVYLSNLMQLLSLEDDDNSIPTEFESGNIQDVLIEAVSSIIQKTAQKNPMIIILEDWHWCDSASHQVIKTLINTISDCQLFVIVSYRPEKDFHWQKKDKLIQIKLAALNKTHIEKLIISILNNPKVSTKLTKQLHGRSGGNPFFLEELIHTLNEGGLIKKINNTVSLVETEDSTELPVTIQGVIRSRLDRLEPTDQEIVKMASVAGVEFTPDIIKLALPRNSNITISIDKLCQLGILRQLTDRTELSYQFHHILTRDVAYDGLLKREKKDYHGAIGNILENKYDPFPGDMAIVLMDHFGKAEYWEKAIYYGLKAADYIKESSFANAMFILEKVEKWIHHLEESDTKTNLLTETLLRQERACETLGQTSRQKEIIETLLELIKDDNQNRARILTRLGDLYTLTNRYLEANNALLEAYRLSKKLKDTELELLSLRSLGYLKVNMKLDDEAITIMKNVIDIEKQKGNANAIVQDLVSLFTIYLRNGHLHEAKQCMNTGFKLESKVRYRNLTYVNFMGGSYWRHIGEFEKAIPYFKKIVEVRQKSDMKVTPTIGPVSLAHCYLQLGKEKEALKYFTLSINLSRKGKTKPQLAIALFEKAKALISLSKLNDAFPLLEEAVILYESLEDIENKALVIKAIANCYELQTDFLNALEAWNKIISISNKKIPLKTQLDAYKGKANALRKLDKSYSQIMKTYMLALTIANKSGNLYEQGSILNSMGITSWTNGDFEKALHYYNKALHVSRQNNDDIHTGFILNSLASTLIKLNRLEKAINRIDEAMAYHKKTKETLLESQALSMKGDACFRLKQMDSAIKYYEHSYRLKQKIADKQGEGWLLTKLARVYKFSESKSKSKTLAKKAEIIAKELNDTYLLKESQLL